MRGRPVGRRRHPARHRVVADVVPAVPRARRDSRRRRRPARCGSRRRSTSPTPCCTSPARTSTLLSADRRVLQLPHGAVVRAIGRRRRRRTPRPTCSCGSGRRRSRPCTRRRRPAQVQLDIPSRRRSRSRRRCRPPARSSSATSSALWEVRVERFAASVLVDVAARRRRGATPTLTEAVEAALRVGEWPASSGMRIDRAGGAVGGDADPRLCRRRNRTQRLTFRCRHRAHRARDPDERRADPRVDVADSPCTAPDPSS